MFDSLYAQEPARKDNSEPWLLSYSDLITNLFVFFAFLLSISMINRHRLETITNYFREKPKYSLMDLKNQIDAIIKKNKLEDILLKFNSFGINSIDCKKNAARFSKERFQTNFKQTVAGLL